MATVDPKRCPRYHLGGVRGEEHLAGRRDRSVHVRFVRDRHLRKRLAGRRVYSLDVLELPIIPDDTTAVPGEYWPDRISRAAFTVTRVERGGRKGRVGPHVLVVATP